MLHVPIITGARGEDPTSGNSWISIGISSVGYIFLCSYIRHNFFSWLATNVRVVRTGVPMTNGGRGNHALIRIPFLLIILGTVGLGGLNATRY